MDKMISKRSNFATATSHRSSKSVNNSAKGSKRDALAELTNSLIPTDVLLDLCSNSISTSKAQDLLRGSQTSTIPVSKNLPKSKSDSKSDTSIGSSNFNNLRDAQNPTPVRRHLSGSSSTGLGNGGHKLIVFSRKTSETLEGPREIDSDIAISPSVKNNMKDEGKLIPVHLNTTPSYKAKNKWTAVAVPLDLIHSEKKIVKEKGIAVPLSSTSAEKVRDQGNLIVSSRSRTPAKKPKDKGKSIAVPFSSTDEKGKAVAAPVSQHNEQAKDKEKSTAMLINHPLNKKARRNVRTAISSCPPLWRTRSIRDKLNETDDVKPSKAWSDPHPKNKKARYLAQQTVSDYSLAQEFEKQKAYFQEIDAFELPVEEVSGSDLD